MLFLTHHKCGSAWLTGVLHAHYADRLGAAVYHSDRSDEFPDDPSAYRYCALINADYPFLKDRIRRAVHVVRNPLAIVVSAYFSHLLSHPTDRWPHLAAQRERLRGLSKADGLQATFEFVSSPTAFDHRAVGPLWGLAHFDYDDPRILTIRMEDLVAYPAVVLPRACEFLGEPCPADLLARLDEHTFERKTGGRQAGDVDPAAHYRSGNPSDWVRHLSFDAARAISQEHADFMERFYPETAALLRAGSPPQAGAIPEREAVAAPPPAAPCTAAAGHVRPPAVHRAPPDKIIHFHLPKTGGTSLNRWFDMLVPSCRARPPERGEIVLAEAARRAGDAPQVGRTPEERRIEHYRWHREFGREARAHWSVIHDHSPAILTPDPSYYRVVVLREPIDRFLSFLRDWRRLTEQDLEQLPPGNRDLRRAARDLDVNEFVRRFARHPDITGLQQTWALVSAASFALPSSDAPSIAALAQDALVRLFDFVGITENLDLATQCIARDLGAPAVASLGRYNAGQSRGAADTLSAESRQLLEQIFAADVAVYRCARELFEAQARRLAAETYDEATFEERYLASRLARLTPRFVDDSTVFSLDDQIVGSGFHGRESPGTEQVSLWTGPGTRSVLYVPVPPGERLDLFFDIGEAITPAVRRSLRIRIDGHEPPILRRTIAEGVERLSLPIATTGPVAKVELLVDSALTPREAGHDSADSRRLGINVRGYGYALLPATSAPPTPLGMPYHAYHTGLVTAVNRSASPGPVLPPGREHRAAPQTADERLLDSLSRELDELETRARMDGEFERIDPTIIDGEASGRRFRFIIFNKQSRNWFGHGRPLGAPAPVALGFVRSDDVVFDIGSTAGYAALWFGLAVGPRGRVLAFDPLPWNAAAIRHNAQLNGLDNVRSFPVGLSDRASRLRLCNGVQRPIDVPWCADVDTRLDAIGDYAHEAPTFIHMRADGLEHALSQADWNRFPRLERLFLEMHPQYCESLGHDPREVLIRFASHGFTIRRGNPTASPIDPVAIPAIESAGWLLDRAPRA